jgi:hypothetical protein
MVLLKKFGSVQSLFFTPKKKSVEKFYTVFQKNKKDQKVEKYCKK